MRKSERQEMKLQCERKKLGSYIHRFTLHQISSTAQNESETLIGHWTDTTECAAKCEVHNSRYETKHFCAKGTKPSICAALPPVLRRLSAPCKGPNIADLCVRITAEIQSSIFVVAFSRSAGLNEAARTARINMTTAFPEKERRVYGKLGKFDLVVIHCADADCTIDLPAIVPAFLTM